MKPLKTTAQLLYIIPCSFLCLSLLGLIEVKAIITFLKYALITIILSASVSCSQHENNSKVTGKDTIIESVPNWLSQNIDKESSCEIIPCDNIKIVTVGNSFTATYQYGSFMFYKSDKIKTGLDFSNREWEIIYYSDSCKLKEDLRWFIKLKMVEYISSKIYK